MYGSKERMEHNVAPTLTAAQETKLLRRTNLRLIPIDNLDVLGVSCTAQTFTLLISYLKCR
ncbi:hypothetical protein PAXINDRAFT_168710 [Paxillus involutus ATCC 200175]|nr:hypothetical protein PAXINDRAFT_168710 [Paxillus involutus ATCC 200175]